MDDIFIFSEQDEPTESTEARPHSTLFGTDPEALKILLDVHAQKDPTILDVTFNAGKMWRGIRSLYNPTTMDIKPTYGTDYVAPFLRSSQTANSMSWCLIRHIYQQQQRVKMHLVSGKINTY